jgi:hypothetical protein
MKGKSHLGSDRMDWGNRNAGGQQSICSNYLELDLSIYSGYQTSIYSGDKIIICSGYQISIYSGYQIIICSGYQIISVYTQVVKSVYTQVIKSVCAQVTWKALTWNPKEYGWPEPCVYTVYDRIFGDSPAKNSVYTPYIYIYSGQPYTKEPSLTVDHWAFRATNPWHVRLPWLNSGCTENHTALNWG